MDWQRTNMCVSSSSRMARYASWFSLSAPPAPPSCVNEAHSTPEGCKMDAAAAKCGAEAGAGDAVL